MTALTSLLLWMFTQFGFQGPLCQMPTFEEAPQCQQQRRSGDASEDEDDLVVYSVASTEPAAISNGF